MTFVSSEHGQNSGVIKIKERAVFTLPFVSKALDYLDIKSILLDTRIAKLLPKTLQEFFPLKVFYSYDMPIGRKIFNYNELLQGLSNEVLRNVVGSECGCSESSYLYGPHGHVLTGDLSIVSDTDLRSLMKFGTKYREPRYVADSDLRHSLVTAIERFLSRVCREHVVSMGDLS